MRRLALSLALLILLCALCVPARAHEPDFLDAIPNDLRAALDAALPPPYAFVDGFRDPVHENIPILLLEKDGALHACVVSTLPDGTDEVLISSPLPSLDGVTPCLSGWGNCFQVVYEWTDAAGENRLDYEFLPLEDGSWYVGSMRRSAKGAAQEALFDVDFGKYTMFLRTYAPKGGMMEQNGVETIYGAFDRDMRRAALPVTEADARAAYTMDGHAMVASPNPADRLNLRKGPSRDSASLGRYYNGVIVRVVREVPGGWIEADIEGARGYLMREYLAFGDAVNGVPRPDTPLDRSLHSIPGDGQTLPLYTAPDSGGGIVCLLPYYADVYIIGDLADGWHHVLYKGLAGYLQAQYLLPGNG